MSGFGEIHELPGQEFIPLELNPDVLSLVREIQAQNAAILRQNEQILRWSCLTFATFVSTSTPEAHAKTRRRKGKA